MKFYASLGNHDDPNQRFYKPFNMNGERYYSFKAPQGSVRFFALDSNYMDKAQLDWLEKELAASDSDWKICSSIIRFIRLATRTDPIWLSVKQLEPLFLKHSVDLVLTGHEHFYERLKPQKGINYIISGSAAKLRKGNIGASDLTAKGYDQGYAFLVMEIAGDDLHFQAITDGGRTVDSGHIRRRVDTSTARQGGPGR